MHHVTQNINAQARCSILNEKTNNVAYMSHVIFQVQFAFWRNNLLHLSAKELHQ